MTPYASAASGKRRPSGPACASCILGGCSDGRHYGLGFMQSDGAQHLDVMIVAEALGHHEAIQEKALVGNSGFLLGKVMSRLGWSRDHFSYANSLYCEPSSHELKAPSGALHSWAERALQHCPHLDEEITRRQPKAILALGDVAFRKLTGVDNLSMHAARGYVFEAARHPGVRVIPTFHPAFILRGQHALTQTLMWDLEKAVKVAREWPGYEDITCLMDCGLHEWEAYVDQAIAAIRAGVPLALDIETPYKRKHEIDEDDLDSGEDITWQIDRISFAFEASRGASIPWAMPWLPGIERLLRVACAEGLILIWNRAYDRPRLVKATGIAMPIERTRDTMDAFHVLFNALPRKLGFATSCLPHAWRLRAWKHLSRTQPGVYSVMDAVALWRNDQDILRLLDLTGQRQIFGLVCPSLDPVLERMTLAGVKVDIDKKAVLESDLIQTLNDLRGQMTKDVPVSARRQHQPWKGRQAAEAAVARLKAAGEVLPEDDLFAIPYQRSAQVCSVCGAEGKAHTKRKTLAVAESTTGVAGA